MDNEQVVDNNIAETEIPAPEFKISQKVLDRITRRARNSHLASKIKPLYEAYVAELAPKTKRDCGLLQRAAQLQLQVNEGVNVEYSTRQLARLIKRVVNINKV